MHPYKALCLVAAGVVLGGCGAREMTVRPAPQSWEATGKSVPAPQLRLGAFRFEATVVKRAAYPYLLYLPEDYPSADRRWPLLMFLHGAGERGDDLKLISVHGPAKLISQGRQFPFIVVSPQCPADSWWDIDVLNALLDEILAHYRVDEKRVYLTGLSMGGYGTWDFAISHPTRFAAIAPICGGSGRGPLVEKLKQHGVPVWTFHGAKDETVPTTQTEYLVKRLKAHSGDVKFTVYPDIGHNAWDPAYDDPALYDWLLSHRRP